MKQTIDKKLREMVGTWEDDGNQCIKAVIDRTDLIESMLKDEQNKVKVQENRIEELDAKIEVASMKVKEAKMRVAESEMEADYRELTDSRDQDTE